MTSASKPSQTSLFQVYLRLRPPISQHKDGEPERCLTVDPPEHHEGTGEDSQEGPSPVATHITLQPPADSRKRAIERFGFTKVFEEGAAQLDVFQDTGMENTIRGVLLEGRDGLVATLGVTGSGKVRLYPQMLSQRRQQFNRDITESYNTRLEDPERTHADGPGRYLPIPGTHNQTPGQLD